MKASGSPIRLAIFASGRGSNAERIIDYFRQADHRINQRAVVVALIVSNKPRAGVLDIALRENIPTLLIEKENFFRGSHYLDELRVHRIDFLVLAGFLWKIPPELIRAYPDRIINIHPALLPAYGGKGMYGQAVHEAVVNAKEKESGITIHYVDELYDHGKIILQARCSVSPEDNAVTLAQKIHALEYEYYPPAISEWIESKLSLNQ